MSNSKKTSQEVLKRADISTLESQTLDLNERYPQIVDTIAEQTGFIPQQEIEIF